MRFDRAYVTSGVCGPSRMSYYTGRYAISHGATWNRVPLSVGEVTLGEMLRGADLTLALTGKTHVMPDHAGLQRLQLDGAQRTRHPAARMAASTRSTATTATTSPAANRATPPTCA